MIKWLDEKFGDSSEEESSEMKGLLPKRKDAVKRCWNLYIILNVPMFIFNCRTLDERASCLTVFMPPTLKKLFGA